MSSTFGNQEDRDLRRDGNESNESLESIDTLRLLAELPPPDGLNDRVHRRLDARMDEELAPRRGFWSLWMPVRRLQYAGVAVLVVALAGATWSVRHSRDGAPGAQPLAPSAAQPGHAFGSAGAEAHPASLKPILVPPAQGPKKKPSASRAAKRVPKAAPDAAAQTPVAP
jgi:hypothetical protein